MPPPVLGLEKEQEWKGDRERECLVRQGWREVYCAIWGRDIYCPVVSLEIGGTDKYICMYLFIFLLKIVTLEIEHWEHNHTIVTVWSVGFWPVFTVGKVPLMVHKSIFFSLQETLWCLIQHALWIATEGGFLTFVSVENQMWYDC